MRALLLFAALFLFGRNLNAAPAHQSSPATTAVLFDFSRPVPEPFWEDLKGELEQNTAPVWPERSITWMKRQQFQKGMEYSEVVQVRLQGRCKADLTIDRQFAEGPLGWVYMFGGEIQPVVYVNCDRIGQTLERDLRGMNSRERQQKFVRAISHVVGHELTHIFLQSAKHSSSGLQRAYLTPRELVKEGLI